jgi:hypothetical protein
LQGKQGMAGASQHVDRGGGVPLPPNLDQPRPEVEQLRRWFEQRGGTLGALRDGLGGTSNGGRQGAASGGGGDAGGRGAGRWLKTGLVVSLATVLLTTGLLVGHVWSGQQAIETPAQSPAAPPATQVVNRPVVPPSCLAALNQGDLAMRLLRNARDPRLAGAVRVYQRSRDECRRQAPGR